jgi:hypothetical protein
LLEHFLEAPKDGSRRVIARALDFPPSSGVNVLADLGLLFQAVSKPFPIIGAQYRNQSPDRERVGTRTQGVEVIN